jgi:hypothetical protein
MSAADATRDVSNLDSPYVGLSSYTQENAAIFFGRDSERTVLISNLRSSRLTLLYAKSGTGKSSLLHAGVTARLTELAEHSFNRRGTARNIPVVFSSWRDDPTAGLIGEIRTAISPFLPAASRPIPVPDRLEVAIEAANRATDAALLVILDQFEEHLLYRTEEVRDRPFADELAACINRADLRANFLISIREDAYYALGDLFKGRVSNVYGNYFHLEDLTREAAREAIEKPVMSFNDLHMDQAPVQIEPGLVDAVLAQVGPDQSAPDQGGGGRFASGNGAASHRGEIQAPYLQLVMKRLWDVELSRRSRKLRLKTLDDLGGAEIIVRNHVDQVLGGLPDEERKAAVAIFGRLVTPSGTKIALSASDLAEDTNRPADEANVLLQRLASSDTRILRPVPPPSGGPDETRFEISHDLLASTIQKWNGRQKEARLEQEKESAQRQARAERINARRFRALAIVSSLIAALAVAAMIAAFVAINAERAAVDRQHVAQSAGMAAEAMDLLPANGPLARLLSLQAYETAPTLQAESVLIQAVQPRNGRLVSGSPVASVAFSPDGRILAVGDSDGDVGWWDVATGQRTGTLAEGAPVTSVVFSPSGRILAVGDSGGDVGWWDVATGRRIGLPLAEGAPVTSVVFSPSGQILAVGDSGGDVGLWDVATGQRTVTLAEGAPVTSVVFSPSGQILAVGSINGDVGLWEAVTGRRAAILAEGNVVTSAGFSSDGQILAVGDSGGDVGLWDVATGQRTGTLADGDPVESVTFIPRSSALVTGDSLGNAGIWNAASRQQSANLTEGGAVTGLAYSSHDQVLAIGDSNGGTVLLRQNLANLTQRYFTQLVCGRNQENMTQAQWADYASGQPYQKTCP